LLLPALAATKPASASFQCQNDKRQLGLACLLYANDNHDRLPSNSDRANVPPPYQNWTCPMGVILDWTASSANTNTLYLIINTNLLGRQVTAQIGSYVAYATSIFRCPADNYLSTVQQSLGWQNRIRSCAMNGAMGDGYKWFAPNNPGDWPAFYNVKKVTDMHNPGPANCWLIMDEHPNSDDDVTFYVNPAYATGNGTGTFTELPGSMHNGAAGLVYADGHAEVHQWLNPQTIKPVNPSITFYMQNVSVTSDQDLTWLAQHTPQN
jgi:prepilin-type processing-associated H-X9-DG protein